MTHDEAYPRLADLLWMRIADGDEVSLGEHVDGCDRCQERLLVLRGLHRTLGDLDGERVPDALRERIEQIPSRHPQPPLAAPRFAIGGRALAGAAGVAAALVGALAIALFAGGGEPPNSAFRATEEVVLASDHTAAGGRLEIGEAKSGIRSLRLSAHGLPAAEGPYELWLANETGQVSAGTFRPNPGGACIVMLSAPDADWDRATIVPVAGGAPVTSVDL